MAYGLVLERLVEVQAPERQPAKPFERATQAWARPWPTEEIWVARKRVDASVINPS